MPEIVEIKVFDQDGLGATIYTAFFLSDIDEDMGTPRRGAISGTGITTWLAISDLCANQQERDNEEHRAELADTLPLLPSQFE
jgi:hypothetical protein